MVMMHYNSDELMNLVKVFSYAIEIIRDYTPQNAREVSIVQDLQCLLQSRNYDEAEKTIMCASAAFKREFDYTPVTDAVAYFKGAVPTINERKIAMFIQKIKSR